MRLLMPHLSFVWMESMFETYLGYTINSGIQGEIRSPFVFIQYAHGYQKVPALRKQKVHQ